MFAKSLESSQVPITTLHNFKFEIPTAWELKAPTLPDFPVKTVLYSSWSVFNLVRISKIE